MRNLSKHAGRTRRGWSAQSSARLAIVFGLAVSGLAGCSTGPSITPVEADAAAPETRRTREVVRPDLPSPPSVAVDAVRPRVDDALGRARMSYAAVVDSLSLPDYLTAPDEAGTDGAQSASDPLGVDQTPTASIRAYGRARDRYRHGQPAEARQLLEEALRLDPHAHQVLRLLGRIYIDMNQSAKGALYLRQAVRIRPDDAWSLYQLGRFAHGQRRWAEAIVTLERALSIEPSDLDIVVTYLSRYLIGQSLLQLGHDTAGIEQLNAYLSMPDRLSRTSRMGRELGFLHRQRGAVWVQIGDAHCRLGEYAAADRHYRLAIDAPTVNRAALHPRQVYLSLRFGEDEAAIDSAIDQLSAGEYSRQTFAPAHYVIEHTGQPERIIQRVRDLYDQSHRSTRLAEALAALLDDDQAVALLVEHVSVRPEDYAVGQTLMDRLMPDRLDQAVQVTLTLIRQRPDEAVTFAEMLIDRVSDRANLREALRVEADRDKGFAAHYLYAQALQRSGLDDGALFAYETAFERNPDFLVAQIGAIEMLLRAGDHEAAQERLASVSDESDPRVKRFRVMVHMRMDQYDAAMVELKPLIDRDPRDISLRELQAEILIAQGNNYQAELALLSILDMAPTYERAYESLLSLYAQLQDQTKSATLMRRMQSSIPNSRFARLRRAAHFIARRQYAQARSLLEALVAEDRDDLEAFRDLAGVLVQMRSWGQVEQLFVQRVEEDPEDETVVSLLLMMYREADQTDQLDPYFQMAQRVLGTMAETYVVLVAQATLHDRAGAADQAIAAYHRALAIADDSRDDAVVEALIRLYLEQDRIDDALALMDEQAERNPDQAGDWWFLKSTIYEQQGQPDMAEQMLVKVLEVDPDNPVANNNLGYSWAEAGRNLELAEAMIDKALAARPDEAAYLDSKGWVLYKLGRFAQAVDWLKRAAARPTGRRDPLLHDHLGDALWRNGDRAQAKAIWQLAVAYSDKHKLAGSPEAREYLLKVHTAAKAKLSSAATNQPPEVAPIGPMKDAEHDASSAAPPDVK